MKMQEMAWNALRQTQRLALLNLHAHAYSHFVGVVECSHLPFDELPTEIQALLESLDWKKFGL